MSPAYIPKLERLAHTLKRWDAQVLAATGLAAALGWLAVFSLLDLAVHVSRFGRAVSATGVVLLLGYAVWRISRALNRAYPAEAVAARVERTFPELDNHLINHLQFARVPGHDPFTAAYLRQEEPKLQGLDFRQLRNRRAHWRSQGILAAVLILAAVPWLFVGPAWGVAVWRMLNPFTTAAPVTLTKLLEVVPGNTTVLQGQPLVIEAKIDGFSGHAVKLELRPEDGDRKTVLLGSVTTAGEQVFSHRLAQINAGVQYRVLAGDAPPSDWFTVDTRPPPAFTGITLTMTPPDYTGKPPARYDALAEETLVYQGARIDLAIRSNTPLTSVAVVTAAGETFPLATGDDDRAWTGSATLLGGQAFTLRAVDIYQFAFDEQVTYQLFPDRAPALEIVAPRGRVQLPPGQSPRIEFSVADDYGLASAEIQQVTGADQEPDAGTVVQRWALDNATSRTTAWTADRTLRPGEQVTYRVVVQDNFPFADQQTRSVPLTFSTTGHGDLAEERQQLEQQAVAGLQQLIELQRTNITVTETGLAAPDQGTAQHWDQATERQRTIRSLTREMLENPIQPFGGLTPTVKKLYLDEMVAAVRLLDGLAGSAAETRPARGQQALEIQQQILKQFGYAQAEAASAAGQRRASALSAMLTAMIRAQEKIIKTTRGFQESGARVGAALVDAQDALPADLTAFRDACRKEADSVRGNDEAFAGTLDDIAAKCESLAIRNQMILAAERLDENQPAAALPHEEQSLAALQTLEQAMGEVALEQEQEKRTVLAEALGNARERLDRVRQLRRKLLESIDAIRGQEDQSEGPEPVIEEAYEKLVRNTREAVLQIPVDLHTFADMLAANDLVEDVFQVFQEIEQAEGTETGDQDTKLLDYAKEDANLELMDEAIERIDEIETWLLENPDEKRVTAEAFDREEMPEEGVAKGELAEAVEDLISDLLEEDEQQEEDAQDSASTHGVTDMETGWGVEEGETVTFSAKGKSGNRTPDHKEQDGRSNVGRQGMAVGETAAASGTINEGDKNIEERRTEDPTQAGKIELAGEADTRATGGGKKGTGKADDYGMSGGVKRIDSDEQGSWEGMAALMAKRVDEIYASASLKNIRVDALKTAAHHLRQAEDAIASGDIQQMKEFRRLAAVDLQQARARLEAGPSGAIEDGRGAALLDDVVEGGPDMAPEEFRDQVADYYRALNDLL